MHFCIKTLKCLGVAGEHKGRSFMKSVLRTFGILTAFLIALTSLPAIAQIVGSDNSKDTSKWETNVASVKASLVKVNTRLKCCVASPYSVNGFGEAFQPWILNTVGNSDGFDVVLDVFNNVNLTLANNTSVGMTVTGRQNADDSMHVEQYCNGSNGDGMGFPAALGSAAGREVQPYTTPTSHSIVTTASVRRSYNRSTQILTAYHDTTGSGDGYQWQIYGSFGVAGSCGSTADDPDPDKNGVVNLVDYPTGLNLSSFSPFSTPLASVSGASIEFYCPRSVAAVAAGTTFVVESSNALASGSWSTAVVTQQVRAALPAGTNGQRFIRLRITSSQG